MTASNVLPIGSVIPFAGPDPNALEDQGWLHCDGRELSRSGTWSALFDAIGTFWGESPDRFAIPDLRGQFLRTRAGDAADRDPDGDRRTPLGTGEPGDIGSLQEYGTGAPREPFESTIQRITRARGDFFVGIHDRPAKASSGNSTTKTSGGGDSESRPVNKYVHFLIKYTDTVDGVPVELPIGGLAALAGNPVEVSRNWLLCNGGANAPLGMFEPLFDVIGFAHGKYVDDGRESYVLPDYRGYFLRGVTGQTSTDPDAGSRSKPYQQAGREKTGNQGNAVGSEQGWATGAPRNPFNISYPKCPTEDGGRSKTRDHAEKVYRLHEHTASREVTRAGGDPETCPDHWPVLWYIRYR